jgi:alginate O-acetyltransferase complex protein AlgI
MLFNSFEFIFVFLPSTLLCFYLLCRLKFFRAAAFSLIMASLVFYSYWDVRYLPLLVFSILFNYILGKGIERWGSRRLLALGCLVDLGLLCYFKYTCFLLNSCNAVFDTSFIIPQIIMPIGISFFTFTQLAYLVDAYRGETAGYDLISYGLFVTFFPHLIAGPILYHKDIIPQLIDRQNYQYSDHNLSVGLMTFFIGLFKKVIIADQLSGWVKAVFENVSQVSFLDAWAGALAYTFQLYYDFSGYSDMAIGLGFMLNIHLPINFNSPYAATSIIDFWKRWHMTLSTFLKNYLYIPLGGSRCGEARRTLNLMITMLLGGLWHGAGWTFVIWGGLHGFFIVVNHLWRRLKIDMPLGLAHILTFVCVVFGWVFFRAHTVYDALEVVKAMVGCKGVLLPVWLEHHLTAVDGFGVRFGKLPNVSELEVFVVLSVLLVLAARFKNTQQLLEVLRPRWWIAVGMGVMGAVSLLRLNKATEFLYFQF